MHSTLLPYHISNNIVFTCLACMNIIIHSRIMWNDPTNYWNKQRKNKKNQSLYPPVPSTRSIMIRQDTTNKYKIQFFSWNNVYISLYSQWVYQLRQIVTFQTNEILSRKITLRSLEEKPDNHYLYKEWCTIARIAVQLVIGMKFKKKDQNLNKDLTYRININIHF